MANNNTLGATTTAADCHYGNIEAFETKYSVYSGAGRTRGACRNEADVVIDLAPGYGGTGTVVYGTAQTSSNIFHLKGTDSYLDAIIKKALDYLRTQVVFEISWDDMSVPPLNRNFFLEFAAALEDGSRDFVEKHGRQRKILVMCAGGHGRTGTLLTILAIINGVIKGDKECIEHMRDMYCENCVETYAQAELIAGFCTETVRWSLPPKMKQEVVKQGSLFGNNEYKFPAKEDDSKKALGGGHGTTGYTQGSLGDTINNPEFDYEYNPLTTKWTRKGR